MTHKANFRSMGSKSTPAETEALPSDKPGSLTEPPFNYASVIVMLQYLQGHTRPV